MKMNIIMGLIPTLKLGLGYSNTRYIVGLPIPRNITFECDVNVE